MQHNSGKLNFYIVCSHTYTNANIVCYNTNKYMCKNKSLTNLYAVMHDMKSFVKFIYRTFYQKNNENVFFFFNKMCKNKYSYDTCVCQSLTEGDNIFIWIILLN